VHNTATVAEALSIPLDFRRQLHALLWFLVELFSDMGSSFSEAVILAFSTNTALVYAQYVLKSILTKHNNSEVSKCSNSVGCIRGKCSVGMETFFSFLGCKIL